MENVALQSQLQAVSLGASMAQRRIENQRLQKQIQMQVGEQLLRERQFELQEKIQNRALAESLREQEAMITDFPLFNEYTQQVTDFLNSPDPQGKIPTPPAFKSKTYQQEANRAIQGMDQYSNRAQMMKAAENARIKANKLDSLFMDEAMSFDAFKRNPETGMILRGPDGIPLVDEKLLSERKAEQRKMAEERLKVIQGGGVGEIKVTNAVKDLATQGILDINDETEVAKAALAIRSGKGVPATVLSATKSADDAVVQLDQAMERVQAFNQKYGKNAFNEYVGPIDAPVFRAEGKYKGLTTAEKEEARKIQQKIAGVVMNYRKGLFGATLTPTETKSMDSYIGTPEGNDYLLLIGGFSENLKSGLKNTSTVFRFEPSLPFEYKKRYAPEIFVREEVVQPVQRQTTQPGATNRVGRFTIEIEGQ